MGMFTAFCAPTQDRIRKGFLFDGDPKQSPRFEHNLILEDPEQGMLTFDTDIAKISELNHIAGSQWGKCWKTGLYELVQKTLASSQSLTYGSTTVRCREF